MDACAAARGWLPAAMQQRMAQARIPQRRALIGRLASRLLTKLLASHRLEFIRSTDTLQIMVSGSCDLLRSTILSFHANKIDQTRTSHASWRYGLMDAFHPAANWYDNDVLGIDQGISVLMAENLRSELVWRHFMHNKEILQAMQRTGFHSRGWHI